MDFSIPPTTKALLAEIREFMEAEVYPLEQEARGQGFRALVCEELAKSPYGMFVFNAQAPDAGNMEILNEFGTVAQKERWLRPLTSGEIRSCFTMTEPSAAPHASTTGR